jgi:hypothetical protein
MRYIPVLVIQAVLIVAEVWSRLSGPPMAAAVVILRESRATDVPSSKLSFARYSRNELEVVMDQTARELQHFASFHGFAIHSYESYRSWLERSR